MEWQCVHTCLVYHGLNKYSNYHAIIYRVVLSEVWIDMPDHGEHETIIPLVWLSHHRIVVVDDVVPVDNKFGAVSFNF